MVKRVKGLLVGYLVVLSVTFVLFTTGCISKPVPLRFDVKVDVSMPTEVLEKQPYKIMALSDEISRIELEVKDSNDQTVYTNSTTSKSNVSFQFQLNNAGTYKFLVKGYNSENTVILSGETTGEVVLGATNNFTVNTEFVNGTLEVIVNISQEVLEKYNVSSAKLKLKRSMETNWTEEQLSTNSNPIIVSKVLKPGVWDTSLEMKFQAKDQYVTPEVKEEVIIRSQEIKPAKTSKLVFNVVFQSGKIAIIQQSVDLPYVLPVENLSATANFTQKKLTVSWDYATSGAVFYIYKQVKETVGGQDFYHYEFCGTTTQKSYVIENYDASEHARINGIAVNVVVGNKESGFEILNKSAFTVQ